MLPHNPTDIEYLLSEIFMDNYILFMFSFCNIGVFVFAEHL